MGLICSFLLFLKIQLTISACHLLIKVVSPASYHLRHAPNNITWKIFWTFNEIKPRLWYLTNALLTHPTYTPLSSFPKARWCRRGGLWREKLSSTEEKKCTPEKAWDPIRSAMQNFVSFCKFTNFLICISESFCKLWTCKSRVVPDGCVWKRNLEFFAYEFGYTWVLWMWECKRQWFRRWKSKSQWVCVFLFFHVMAFYD